MQNSVAYMGFRDSAIVCKDFLLAKNFDGSVLETFEYYIRGIDPGLTTLEQIEKQITSYRGLLPAELYSKLYDSFYIYLKEFYLNYKIISTLDDILERPTHFFKYNDVETLKTYLEGFLSGLGIAYFKNLMQLINNWYKLQIDNDIASYWTDYIYDSEHSPEDKADLMVKVAKSYIINNPSWAFI